MVTKIFYHAGLWRENPAIRNFGEGVTMETAEPRWPNPDPIPSEPPIDEETGDEEEETVFLPGDLLGEDEPSLDTSPPDDQIDAGGA